MPIHDLGYRHWTGRWTSHPYRWWVITRQGISLLARKKRFVFIMILSAIPFLVRCVMIYASTVVGKSAPFLQINAKFFEEFLSQQMFFTFITAIYAGSGLISNDLKANALQIYLSKPITRRDYLIGKLGIVVFFLSLPTLALGLLLFLVAVLFEPGTAFFGEYYWVPGAIFVYSLLIVFTYATIILALSSLSRSSRFAGINFAAIFFFSQILFGILKVIFRTTGVAWVSLGNNLMQVGDILFMSKPDYASPQWISLLLLAFLTTGSVWVVHRKIQAVEVVS